MPNATHLPVAISTSTLCILFLATRFKENLRIKILMLYNPRGTIRIKLGAEARPNNTQAVVANVSCAVVGVV